MRFGAATVEQRRAATRGWMAQRLLLLASHIHVGQKRHGGQVHQGTDGTTVKRKRKKFLSIQGSHLDSQYIDFERNLAFLEDSELVCSLNAASFKNSDGEQTIFIPRVGDHIGNGPESLFEIKKTVNRFFSSKTLISGGIYDNKNWSKKLAFIFPFSEPR